MIFSGPLLIFPHGPLFDRFGMALPRKRKTPDNHMGNFFECVWECVQPISDVITHHRTMTSLHLCNVALWLGRNLQWDPDCEEFIGDDQANLFWSWQSRQEFV